MVALRQFLNWQSSEEGDFKKNEEFAGKVCQKMKEMKGEEFELTFLADDLGVVYFIRAKDGGFRPLFEELVNYSRLLRGIQQYVRNGYDFAPLEIIM